MKGNFQMDSNYVASELIKIAKILMSEDEYKDKVKNLMKKYKVKSLGELKDDEKKKFYKDLDDSWVSKKEKAQT